MPGDHRGTGRDEEDHAWSGEPAPGVIYDSVAEQGQPSGSGHRNGQVRAAGSGTIAAELAGWAAGELPGQASARLAAWASVGGVPSGYQNDASGGPAGPGSGTAAG
ncbi:MAG: hypothetical protein LBI49_26435 [Nocardiopsaceae bacterium]|jgi:hypothetical protein|nr:hypothetical protein [Nocardiopsaceae bacterium]